MALTIGQLGRQVKRLSQSALLVRYLEPGPAAIRKADPSEGKRSVVTASSHIQDKIRQLSALSPVPISIAEFLERGGMEKISESSSYIHLVKEVAVRLSHLLIELQHLPQELKEQEDFCHLFEEYLISYSQLMHFDQLEPSPDNLEKWTQFLKMFKERHKTVVRTMARACMNMKEKYGISLEGEDCALSRTVQYSLDRIYTSRISLNMLTDQHLMVYGHLNTVLNQVGVIHPRTDLAAVVRHAYENAAFLCEGCYLTCPHLELTSQNATAPDSPCFVTHIPSHIYHIVFEVMKNAMQATVDKFLEKVDVLPPIKVFICQSDRDVTIRVSDQGGGIDRETSDKIFKYLYTTAPKASLTQETVLLSGLGYGLPLARLYARYFQGDLRAASYEGHGTDIYIYLHALAGEAVERLPIWGTAASNKMSACSSPIPDWTGSSHHQKKMLPRR